MLCTVYQKYESDWCVQVFCGLFPVDADEYQGLREALERLQLNDAALSFEPEVRAPDASHWPLQS